MNRILKNKEAIITNAYSSNHQAVDVVGENYTLDYVISHSDGTVIFLQTNQKNNKGSSGNKSYGNCVKIRHENGYDTLYAHLEYVNVKMNQQVKKGTIIGYMGDTGNAIGKHLHFEVWKNNKRINPTPYLSKSFEIFLDYYPTYNGNTNSIVDALKSLKIDSSYANRKAIALKNNITNYTGTAKQNSTLLNLLKKGKLKKG